MWRLLLLVCCLVLASSQGVKEEASDASLDLDLLLEYLREQVKGIKQEIAETKDENFLEIRSLHQTIADLTRDMERKSEEIKSLHQTIADQNDAKSQEIGYLHQTIADLTQEVERESQEIRKMDETVSKLQKSSPTPVMFHARLSQDAVFADETTIIFDRVETNLGDSYYPAVGIFMCPVDGYYHFYVSFNSRNNRSQGSFMMDGEIIQLGPVTGDEATWNSGHSSQSVSTYCPAGAVVYITAKEFISEVVAADLVGHDTTFSGYLVYAA